MNSFTALANSINHIFEAGIAITGLSLLIRALSFNLKDRVSRSFAFVLACIVIIFSGEAISGAVNDVQSIEFWLRFQWVGILFLPATIQHFSDALLATTGRPSRGRRRKFIFSSYALSTILVVMLALGIFLGEIVFENEVSPYPRATFWSIAFSIYYIGSAVFAAVNIWRAYKRTKLRASRRRITYLFVGAMFVLTGAFPYLQFGSVFARQFSLLFILLVVFGNLGLYLCLLLMAYAVAFFGVPWPDRIVRTRLLKWVMRGPLTVFLMLFLMTITNQVYAYLGSSDTIAIPIVAVITVLFAEHVITLVYPYIDRILLNSGDGDQFYLMQSLSERLITMGDLKQFLEAILAGICDQFQVSTGFVASVNDEGWEFVVHAGEIEAHEMGELDLSLATWQEWKPNSNIYYWGEYWLYPLHIQNDTEIIGMLGVLRKENHQLEDGLEDALRVLGRRASMALEDRSMQRQVMGALEELGPKIELIQMLRASFRFDQSMVMQEFDEFNPPKEFSQWVKDALSHYWGGPKLTNSPLISLQVVQSEMPAYEGNLVNALRAVLKEAIEGIKPEGERKYNPEWLLYNILDMKFIEGRKVRDIAKRLAVSEADLYRKQRIAVESVASTIIDMETKAREV